MIDRASEQIYQTLTLVEVLSPQCPAGGTEVPCCAAMLIPKQNRQDVYKYLFRGNFHPEHL